MRRFRLLGFYVAGLVLLIALTVSGVSLRRAGTDAATPRVRQGGAQKRNYGPWRRARGSPQLMCVGM